MLTTAKEKPIVLFMKCRPQDANGWPIARENNIVFIGYAVSVAHEIRDLTGNFNRTLVDVSRDYMKYRDQIRKKYRQG